MNPTQIQVYYEVHVLPYGSDVWRNHDTFNGDDIIEDLVKAKNLAREMAKLYEQVVIVRIESKPLQEYVCGALLGSL